MSTKTKRRRPNPPEPSPKPTSAGLSADLSTGLCCEVERGPNWLFVRPREEQLVGDAVDVDALVDELWSICERHFTFRLVLESDALDALPMEVSERLAELGDRLTRRGGAMRLCGGADATTCRLDSGHAALLSHRTRRDAVLASDTHESVLLRQ